MPKNLLLYADNKFHLLQYFLSSTTDTYMLKTIDSTLQTIIPKDILQNGCNCYIIDINNDIHYVQLDIGAIGILTLELNINKSTFMNPSIIGFVTENFCQIIHILIKNIGISINGSYEYFKFVHDWISKSHTTVHHIILNNSHVNYVDGRIHVNVNGNIRVLNQNYMSRGTYNLYKHPPPSTLYNILYDRILLHEQSKFVGSKHSYAIYYAIYYAHILDDRISHYFVVDKDNNCYVGNKLEEYNKVCTVSDNSMILYNNFNDTIIILNGNHITAISNNAEIIQFVLPVTNLHYIANTKIKDLVWSKQIYDLLSNSYKDTIRVFMMCNKLMKQYKIPKCVLKVILDIMIN